MCGGTLGERSSVGMRLGLSPRVRGNLDDLNTFLDRLGSIPACAGEPYLALSSVFTHTVYPRVCGGTDPSSRQAPSTPGLSPRVRGNRELSTPKPPNYGSIPACAGEPYKTPWNVNVDGVYPRVYGGTIPCNERGPFTLGLSPRVRGNLRSQHETEASRRSIPACTGEPVAGCVAGCVAGVYPRVYGGTVTQPVTQPATQPETQGLSPRVRGNPLTRRTMTICCRSIPACTGEPFYKDQRDLIRRVYPRVYGGTRLFFRIENRIRGLSPRVRGNRLDRRQPRHKHRSIPACTGEP